MFLSVKSIAELLKRDMYELDSVSELFRANC